MPGTTRYFEDFRLGECVHSPEFTLTVDDLTDFARLSGDRHPMHLPSADGLQDGPIAHGPLGLARYFGTVHESGALRDSVIALLDTNWRYLAPLRVGQRLHYRTTVTRTRRASAGDRGVVNRWIELRTSGDQTLQQGSSAVLVKAHGVANADADPVANTPFSPRWARALATLLEKDELFSSTTELFDGGIGLASENDEVVLRVYRGAIIEAAGRTPAGPDFTLRGAEHSWAGLLTGPENDLIVRVHRGEFWAVGDTYTYLRLTAALQAIVDNLRVMHRAGATA
ncbi:MaoC/PaaZ C-terminal domain-containing protein [Nonomuraea insulae]|uniref:MaoC/PaaZ C-terminal domain-containing protein n=1 Tax=Nonomuraea insulae TaxID=1616787 RepID=A0ABW1CX41_9ACTN